jgi:hypothetical protein
MLSDLQGAVFVLCYSQFALFSALHLLTKESQYTLAQVGSENLVALWICSKTLHFKDVL